MEERFHNLLNQVDSELSIGKKKKKEKSEYNLIKDIDPAQEPQDDSDMLDEELVDRKVGADEYQDEFFGMSVAALKNIAADVNGILEHLDDENVRSNLTEPWLQGMIAVIEDNMSAVHDFVKFSESEDDTTSVSSTKRPGLWENIRKKKEREGKKYKPAKPGDKDRPDPKTWKKLTKKDS